MSRDGKILIIVKNFNSKKEEDVLTGCRMRFVIPQSFILATAFERGSSKVGTAQDALALLSPRKVPTVPAVVSWGYRNKVNGTTSSVIKGPGRTARELRRVSLFRHLLAVPKVHRQRFILGQWRSIDQVPTISVPSLIRRIQCHHQRTNHRSLFNLSKALRRYKILWK